MKMLKTWAGIFSETGHCSEVKAGENPVRREGGVVIPKGSYKIFSNCLFSIFVRKENFNFLKKSKQKNLSWCIKTKP